MFTGFANQKYPEYEVITPQTGESFKIRSINVQEEERFKGSFNTQGKIADHLNRCLFDSLTLKPDHIITFEDFLKNITLKDRECLHYGLYCSSYDDIKNYEVVCLDCSNKYPITIKMSETFNFTPYPDKANILKAVKKINLKNVENVSVFIKQPTLFEEQVTMKQLSGRPDITIDNIYETLPIVKFEEDNESTKKPKVYDDRLDIIHAYRSLTPRDKNLIHSEYVESFGKYEIELKMKSGCPKCGKEDIRNIDLFDNFFRAMYQL